MSGHTCPRVSCSLQTCPAAAEQQRGRGAGRGPAGRPRPRGDRHRPRQRGRHRRHAGNGRTVICSAVKRLIGEKAPTRAFSWLKAATTAFTFKTLLRHYAMTPR